MIQFAAMKKNVVRMVLTLVIFMFALALGACSQSVNLPRNAGAASLSMQAVTPTPPAGDQSVIGSTNGIFIMGIVIVAITTLPVLLHKMKNK